MGVVVLGACATWSLITAAVHGDRPEGPARGAAGYAAGRIFGELLPVAAPCVAAVAGLSLTLALPRLVPGPETVTPLGHAGATAAVLTLSAGAACRAAWATPVPALRLALWLLAGGMAVAGSALGSVMAMVTCGAVLLCSLAAGRIAPPWSRPGGAALVAAAVTGLTWTDGGRRTSRRTRLLGGGPAHRPPDRPVARRPGPGAARPGPRSGAGTFRRAEPDSGDDPLFRRHLQRRGVRFAVGEGALWRAVRATPVVLSALPR
ncbi:O-antigen ligase family protein [Streptomyces bobili]|uniref:O-antigen ligase family protein n=1 Tax=Streptomyces bobili TaxID=67280 RepID=UPI003F541820